MPASCSPLLLTVLLVGNCLLIAAQPSAPAPSASEETSPLTASSQPVCMSMLGGSNVSLVMVADPGDFTGTGEAVHYLANLQNRVNVTSSSFCLSMAYGTLLGNQVMVVATGIGPTTAALCTLELLQCSEDIKEIIWMGTAGYSPQQGGVIDTLRGCDAANPSTAITREGDLCITPWAINWDCKLTDWDDQCAGFPNVCSDPTNEDGPEVSSLYGECIFSTYTGADMALTMEVQAAAEAASFPARSDNLNLYEEEYWNITSDSTGVSYVLDRPVKPWNYTQCAIADSQFFWAGAPWDMVSRNYSAVLVNEALGMNLTQLDMVTVSSEEDIGLVQALSGWNSLVGSGGKQVNVCSLAFISGQNCLHAQSPPPHSPPPVLHRPILQPPPTLSPSHARPPPTPPLPFPTPSPPHKIVLCLGHLLQATLN
ncbi:TPA: hypothetical protein ACH3X2_004945 [Trebouxia sp. C0005]